MATSTGYTPRSDDYLRQQAASQIDADIAGQVAPYQTEIDQANAREGRALGDIGSMFGSLQPYVTGAAQRVGQSYDLAQQGERGVYDAALQRMNSLKSARAAEAQALAQEIGGPVATSQFTDSTAGSEGELTQATGNSLLHGLGLAQAGVQEANAFAGRVFPALRTETEAKARKYYEDQVKGLQDQIATVKSQRTGKINAAYNDLHEKELQHQLDQANLQLNRTVAAHNWAATKAGIRQEDQRIADAEKQFTTTSAQTDRQLTAQEKQFQQTYGLSMTAANRTWQLHQRDYQNQQAATASQYLDAITSPGKVSSVSETHEVPVAAPPDKHHPPAGYYAQPVMKNGKPTGQVQWYKSIKTTTPVQSGTPVTDPNRAYDYLRAHNISERTARTMVAAKFNLPNTWAPHKPKPTPTKSSKTGKGRPG